MKKKMILEISLQHREEVEKAVKFNAENAETRKHFASINALAEFISGEQAKNAD